MTPPPRQRRSVRKDAYGSRIVTVTVEIATRKLVEGWGAAATIGDNPGCPNCAVVGARTRKAALEELAHEIGEAVVAHA